MAIDPATQPDGPLPDAVPQSLPRGRARLPREVVVLSQRQRLLNAIVRAVAEKGYGAVTVADVVERARVSRSTFYEQFADKEECFLVAYEENAQLHAGQVRAAMQSAGGLVERLRALVHTWLSILEAEPDYARTFVLEVLAAGPRALERRTAIHRLYVDLLMAWHAEARAAHPSIPELPPEVFAGAVAAANELLIRRLRHAGAARLTDLAPTVLYMDLALFGLPEAAAGVLAGTPAAD